MKKDLISVIVPCYNVSKFLEDCFLSLENQTYKNVEFIFVNDGSKDDTLKKLEDFCNGKANCKIIDQPNQGVSVARNNGLANASGEYVCFVDSDDLLSPLFLEKLHKLLIDCNCDASACKIKRVKEKYSFKDMPTLSKEKNPSCFYDKHECLLQCIYNGNISSGPCDILFKKNILEKFPTYPNVFNKEIFYGEDLDMKFSYLALCEKVVFTPDEMYFYRTRKGSATTSQFNDKKLSIFKALENKLENYGKDDEEIEIYLRALIAMHSFDLLFRIYKTKYNNQENLKMLFKNLNENKGQLKQAKRLSYYHRHIIPFFCPLLKFLFIGRLKKKKNKKT